MSGVLVSKLLGVPKGSYDIARNAPDWALLGGSWDFVSKLINKASIHILKQNLNLRYLVALLSPMFLQVPSLPMGSMPRLSFWVYG